MLVAEGSRMRPTSPSPPTTDEHPPSRGRLIARPSGSGSDAVESELDRVGPLQLDLIARSPGRWKRLTSLWRHLAVVAPFGRSRQSAASGRARKLEDERGPWWRRGLDEDVPTEELDELTGHVEAEAQRARV